MNERPADDAARESLPRPLPHHRPLPRNQVLVGDATARLGELDTASVDMVFTSPPYFRLRDYASGKREIGQEEHIEEWVEALVEVVRECTRVLVPTGTLWINVGDTYSTGMPRGAGRKSLLLGPSRLALRLIEAGLLLRNDIVWHKANHLPHPVRDRLTPAWEHLFLFAKQADYYFDLDAIREPHLTTQPSSPCTGGREHAPRPLGRRSGAGTHPRGRDDRRRDNHGLGSTGLKAMRAAGRVGHPLGKNPGDVWRIPTSNYTGAHRAAMPVELARRAIKAACPALRPDGTPGIVLDPFLGSGTTAIAAQELGRDWLGIELNPQYAELARTRIEDEKPTTP